MRKVYSVSKIEWKSDKDKFEAIGYLAKPGVVASIEVTVPSDKLDKFKEDYAGKYSEEFPYVTQPGSKYGYQFRIYLSDTEGCPEFLQKYVDKKYGNRINDNRFIAELVKNYGFRFTKAPQNDDRILEQIREKAGEFVSDYQRGYQVYSNFLQLLSDKMKQNTVPSANIVQPKVSVRKASGRKSKKTEVMKSAFTTEQLFRLGWLGELYIYKLLYKKDKALLEALQINPADLYNVEWYNEGAAVNKKWSDKSVGKGCDITITINKKKLYIEVKSSKRKNGLFVMTSKEMKKMRDKGDNYYLIKVNWLEKLLKNESPDMYVFSSPYDLFFKPEKMKEATFRVEGDIDE